MKQNLSQASVPSAFPDENRSPARWWQRFNWPFLCAILWGIAVWTFIVWAAISLCGCATKKELYEHHSHQIQADTLAWQAQADTHMQAMKNYADSLFAAYSERNSVERNSRSEEEEIVTETITTTVDSLGRQRRTEQRTITRALSREEQQRQEQLISDLRREFSQRMETYRQEQQQHFAVLLAHWQDSLAALTNVKSASAPQQPLWWQRLQTFVAVAIIAFALFTTRRWWKKLQKK